MYKMCLTMDIKNIMKVDETKATSLASKILNMGLQGKFYGMKTKEDKIEFLKKINVRHSGFQRQKIF